jgi:flagellar biosynthesis repressor protein FlbT
MIIHLKRNEKLFINGAVIRLDRRGSIELMNDAQFMLENHVMQQEQATTPLRQLYFIAQTMLMDPENAHLTLCLFRSFAQQLKFCTVDRECVNKVSEVESLVEQDDYYNALKLLRKLFAFDDQLTRADENFATTEAA